MRYIIIYSLFLIFVYSCTTVKVAREAGKAIKSIDNTITLSEKEKNIEKKEEKKIVEEKKDREKRNKQQKALLKFSILGKESSQLITLFGKPKLIRESGNTILMRFNNSICIAYAYIAKDDIKQRVKYFEIRDLNGKLISKKSDINYCLETFT